jgi:cytokinesis protein
MESLFGRKKRPRQSSVSGQDLDERSVPYDRTTAARSPVPVGTVSQALRGTVTPVISAPITNPTLTSGGTELNKSAMLRRRAEREFNYGQDGPGNRTGSPSPSVSSTGSMSKSGADASTLSNPTTGYTTTTSRRTTDASLTASTSSSAGLRSPIMADFGQFSQGPASPGSRYPNFAGSTYRPNSTATHRSDTNRNSKYAPSVASSNASESYIPHMPHLHLHHRHSSVDEFNFPRPETDEEVEALFERVKSRLGIHDSHNITIDQKWQIVHQDEQARFREERKKQSDIKRQTATGQPVVQVFTKDTPEWYLKKFMDMSITPKHVQSLAVSLRTLPIA